MKKILLISLLIIFSVQGISQNNYLDEMNYLEEIWSETKDNSSLTSATLNDLFQDYGNKSFKFTPLLVSPIYYGSSKLCEGNLFISSGFYYKDNCKYKRLRKNNDFNIFLNLNKNNKKSKITEIIYKTGEKYISLNPNNIINNDSLLIISSNNSRKEKEFIDLIINNNPGTLYIEGDGVSL